MALISNALLWATMIVGIALLAVTSLASYLGNEVLRALFPLIMSVLILLFFFSLAFVPFGIRKVGVKVWRPTLAFIMFFLIMFCLGYPNTWLADRGFRHRLPAYREVVRLVEQRKTGATTNLSRIHELNVGIPESVVLAAFATDGSLVVEFQQGGGFPVKHIGYLYVSSDEPQSQPWLTNRWSRIRRVEKNWFAFAD